MNFKGNLYHPKNVFVAKPNGVGHLKQVVVMNQNKDGTIIN